MTLEERAAIIVGGVVRAPGMEAGDREHVVRQLEEYRVETLKEAAKVMCVDCRDSAPSREDSMALLWLHDIDGDTRRCAAAKIWEAIKSE